MATENVEATPMNLNSWFCHIGTFHSYLTQVLESTPVHGYFKPRARRVWVEGLRVLADIGASLLRTRGSMSEALFYSKALVKVADLIRDLKLNSSATTDLPDDLFRKWVGNFYDSSRETPAESQS